MYVFMSVYIVHWNHRNTDTQKHRSKFTQNCKNTCTHTITHEPTHIHSHTSSQPDTHRQTDTHASTHIHSHTNTHTQADSKTHTDRHTARPEHMLLPPVVVLLFVVHHVPAAMRHVVGDVCRPGEPDERHLNPNGFVIFRMLIRTPVIHFHLLLFSLFCPSGAHNFTVPDTPGSREL
jgi:hypothetical protein